MREFDLEDPGDVNDLFAEMTEGLGDLEEPEEILDYTAMDRMELIARYNEIYAELADHNALIEAKTEDDEDLQAQYYGVLLEMRKRGLK